MGEFAEGDFCGTGVLYGHLGEALVARFKDGVPLAGSVGVQWDAERRVAEKLEFVDHQRHVEHRRAGVLSPAEARGVVQRLVGKKGNAEVLGGIPPPPPPPPPPRPHAPSAVERAAAPSLGPAQHV